MGISASCATGFVSAVGRGGKKTVSSSSKNKSKDAKVFKNNGVVKVQGDRDKFRLMEIELAKKKCKLAKQKQKEREEAAKAALKPKKLTKKERMKVLEWREQEEKKRNEELVKCKEKRSNAVEKRKNEDLRKWKDKEVLAKIYISSALNKRADKGVEKAVEAGRQVRMFKEFNVVRKAEPVMKIRKAEIKVGEKEKFRREIFLKKHHEDYMKRCQEQADRLARLKEIETKRFFEQHRKDYQALLQELHNKKVISTLPSELGKLDFKYYQALLQELHSKGVISELSKKWNKAEFKYYQALLQKFHNKGVISTLPIKWNKVEFKCYQKFVQKRHNKDVTEKDKKRCLVEQKNTSEHQKKVADSKKQKRLDNEKRRKEFMEKVRDQESRENVTGEKMLVGNAFEKAMKQWENEGVLDKRANREAETRRLREVESKKLKMEDAKETQEKEPRMLVNCFNELDAACRIQEAQEELNKASIKLGEISKKHDKGSEQYFLYAQKLDKAEKKLAQLKEEVNWLKQEDLGKKAIKENDEYMKKMEEEQIKLNRCNKRVIKDTVNKMFNAEQKLKRCAGICQKARLKKLSCDLID